MEYFFVEDAMNQRIVNGQPLKSAAAAPANSVNYPAGFSMRRKGSLDSQMSCILGMANRSQYEAIMRDPIAAAAISQGPGTENKKFQIKVHRRKVIHFIERSFDDFIILHNGVALVVDEYNLRDDIIPVNLPRLPYPFAAKGLTAEQYNEKSQILVNELNEYLSRFFGCLNYVILASNAVNSFFGPRSQQELETVPVSQRRDSGFDDRTVTNHKYRSLCGLAEIMEEEKSTIEGVGFLQSLARLESEPDRSDMLVDQ